MRIVNVANASYHYLGLRTYGAVFKIHNGFVRNNHDVYLFSEHDVARASNPFGTRKFGKKACNNKLIQVCKNFEPEILALAHANIITAETVQEIRELLPDLIVFQYNIDGLFVPSNVANLLSKSNCVDHTFITTAGAYLRTVAGERSGVSFMPNPVDSGMDTCRNHERDDLETDVIFAGGVNKWVGENDLRKTAPEAIEKRFPDLKCEFYVKNNKIWGAKFKAALCRSKMGLSFSLSPDGVKCGVDTPLYLYSSDRISQYMGNGLLTYAASDSCMSELYGKDSIVEVDGLKDLLEKIKFYSSNDKERKRIAKNGWEVAHREFNERLITQYMIETVLNKEYSYDYAWPTEVYKR